MFLAKLNLFIVVIVFLTNKMINKFIMVTNNQFIINFPSDYIAQALTTGSFNIKIIIIN